MWTLIVGKITLRRSPGLISSISLNKLTKKERPGTANWAAVLLFAQIKSWCRFGHFTGGKSQQRRTNWVWRAECRRASKTPAARRLSHPENTTINQHSIISLPHPFGILWCKAIPPLPRLWRSTYITFQDSQILKFTFFKHWSPAAIRSHRGEKLTGAAADYTTRAIEIYSRAAAI